MATDIGSIQAKMGLDTDDLDRNQKKAVGTLGALGKAASSAAKTVLEISKAAAVASAAVVGFTTAISNSAKEMQNLATLAGETPDDFQKMAFAAKSVGVEQEKLADILKDVQDRVGDFLATGGGPMVDFFERLGPAVNMTADDLRGLSGSEVLGKLQKALDDANVPLSEQIFYLESLASEATLLRPLLTDNASGLNEMTRRAEELGISLTDIDTQVLADFGRSADESMSIFKAFSNELALKFVPIISASSGGIKEFIAESGGVGEIVDGAWQDLLNIIGEIADAIQVAIAIVKEFANVAEEYIGRAGDAIKSGLDFIGFGEEQRAAVANTTGGIVDDVVSSVSEGLDELKDGYAELKVAAADSLGQDQASEVLRDNLKEIEENAYSAAEAMLEMQKRNAEALDELRQRSGGGEGSDEFYDKQKEQLEQQLERFRMSLMTEEELENESYERRLEKLQEFFDNKLISESEYNESQAQINQEHAERLQKIEQDRADSIMRSEDDLAKARSKYLSDAANSLQQFNSKSKALAQAQLAVNKGLAIAETIQNTEVAAMRAYRDLGPILGPPAAAAIGAIGAIKVATIASTGLSGSSSSSSSSTSSPIVGSSSSSQTSSSGQMQESRNVTVNISGLDRSALFSGEMVIELINEINNAVSDGANLRLT